MKATDLLQAALPARLWEEAPEMEPASAGNGEDNIKAARCLLCAHGCLIPPGKNGICGVRFNRDGVLVTLVGRVASAIHLDPVEKKPLFHFMPGTATFSIGSFGCNFRCVFCQNNDISQAAEAVARSALPAEPELLVQGALNSGAGSISYTYNEPTVFFELVQDTARLAQGAGLRNVLVSNGYMSALCLEELAALVHAANIDLKSFSDSFYRRLCGARLNPVLDTLKAAVKIGWWVEVTTLIIPGENDSLDELRDLANFIVQELGPGVPWHVSRFRPAYKMRSTPVTPTATLEAAVRTGKEAGLQFVYVGNLPGHESESTFCPSCGVLVIARSGYTLRGKAPDKCPSCGLVLPGIWK